MAKRKLPSRPQEFKAVAISPFSVSKWATVGHEKKKEVRLLANTKRSMEMNCESTIVEILTLC